MKPKKFIVPNDAEEMTNNLMPVLDYVFELSQSYSVFLLNGEMGVGKTTLMIELGKYLSSSDVISSPTFSIVNEYEIKGGKLVYHFDLYRLKDEEELYDIGFEDYLNKDAIIFIEWPEIAYNFLPDNVVNIEIKEDLDCREIIVQHQ